MLRLEEEVEEQTLKQESALLLKSTGKLEKYEHPHEENHKLTRKERKLLNLLENRKYNPRFYEETKAHYWRTEVWKSDPMVRQYAM